MCDARCNVESCGFDAGDCGMDKVWHLLRGVEVPHNQSVVTVATAGADASYLNLTWLFEDLPLPSNATVSLRAAGHSPCSGVVNGVLNEPTKVVCAFRASPPLCCAL